MTWQGFIPGLIVGLFVGLLIPTLVTKPTVEQEEPIECIDGKLYEVSYQGKIKVLDRRSMMNCEVTP